LVCKLLNNSRKKECRYILNPVIINSKYLETELPELLITESGIIEKISKIVLDSVKDNLKKSFKDKQANELISKLSEDQELIENHQQVCAFR
jgi:hypothetical protein